MRNALPVAGHRVESREFTQAWVHQVTGAHVLNCSHHVALHLRILIVKLTQQPLDLLTVHVVLRAEG
jgi:hypothetical protein